MNRKVNQKILTKKANTEGNVGKDETGKDVESRVPHARSPLEREASSNNWACLRIFF